MWISKSRKVFTSKNTKYLRLFFFLVRICRVVLDCSRGILDLSDCLWTIKPLNTCSAWPRDKSVVVLPSHRMRMPQESLWCLVGHQERWLLRKDVVCVFPVTPVKVFCLETVFQGHPSVRAKTQKCQLELNPCFQNLYLLLLACYWTDHSNLKFSGTMEGLIWSKYHNALLSCGGHVF